MYYPLKTIIGIVPEAKWERIDFNRVEHVDRVDGCESNCLAQSSLSPQSGVEKTSRTLRTSRETKNEAISLHNAWMRAVAGRLKSDYRYSKDIVYNNFIWPEGLLSLRGDSEIRSLGEALEKSPNLQVSKTPSSESNNSATLRLCVKKIEAAAQAILDARAAHPGSTLADLYDPLAMPADLRKAHDTLDALVDKAYGLKPSCTDAERVAHLFKLYADKVKGS